MTEMPYTPVRDVMTPNPIIIDGLATVAQAVELMREHSISSLVIDRRHEGDEYGILAVHDIAENIISKDLSAERVNVYEIMSKPVLSVDVDMNLKYATRLLFRFHLTRALVLENGNVAGLVTLRDMVLRSIGDGGRKRDAPAG
jgi:signal-transduction protein with cAMP-binding, CBS, and nucleotidyltransferase domain